MITRATDLLAWLALLLLGLTGCGFILRHTTNTSSAPDIEIVTLPRLFAIAPPTGGVAKPGDWVLVGSVSAGSTPPGAEAWVFDLSPFLALDPFGPWNSPLPTEQRVFVKASEASRVKIDRDAWNERFVVQLAINSIAEPQRGTSRAERLSFEDPASVLCHQAVTRRMLTSTPIEAVYESKFTDCPHFGPDRVVLTRDLVGNWDSIRHSQAIFSFSYESKGDRLTPAQRSAGMKLIQAPRLVMATQEGEKHPLWRDEQLRLVNNP
jgi:hypothetical protein